MWIVLEYTCHIPDGRYLYAIGANQRAAQLSGIPTHKYVIGGTVLEYVDTPNADTSNRMGPLITSLLQKYGSSWTHSLAVNDLYFDFMGPSLATAGIAGDGAPKAGSAGDGSEATFQRIRTAQNQAITVAGPINLQGWQLVDELHRAISGAPCSGYVTEPAHVTQEGLALMGDSNSFNPDSPYRAEYREIWGK